MYRKHLSVPLCGFFGVNAIRRINAGNANALTESVFLYTLSFLADNPKDTQSPCRDYMEEILSFLCNHFSDPNLTLLKLADLFGYDKKYLSHVFRKRKGIRFTDYLNALRIANAESLLTNTDLSVAQIAKQSGFSDHFYFSKVFKTKKLQTPTEFRNASRK